jgi:hypothetical protein
MDLSGLWDKYKVVIPGNRPHQPRVPGRGKNHPWRVLVSPGVIETGRLRVLDGNCPNLLEDAGLYKYASAAEGGDSDVPIDEYNHALGALRYLVMGIDGGRLLAKRHRQPEDKPGAASDEEAARRKKVWAWWTNPSLWEELSRRRAAVRVYLRSRGHSISYPNREQ